MLNKIKDGADTAISLGIKLISLSIILQIVFGNKVPFFGGNIIGEIINIVWALGSAGLVGLIAAAIVWRLLDTGIKDNDS